MARRFLNGSSKAEAQGVMLSVEEPGLRRRPHLRQHRQLGGGLFALQMRQNPLDHRRVFNAAVRRPDYDLDLTTAPLARLDGAATGSMLNTRLSRCIQVIATWRSAGVLSIQFSPVGWRRLRPLPRIAGVTRMQRLLLGASRQGDLAAKPALSPRPRLASGPTSCDVYAPMSPDITAAGR
jgi:hypothetical protein